MFVYSVVYSVFFIFGFSLAIQVFHGPRSNEVSVVLYFACRVEHINLQTFSILQNRSL